MLIMLMHLINRNFERFEKKTNHLSLNFFDNVAHIGACIYDVRFLIVKPKPLNERTNNTHRPVSITDS